MNYVEHFIFGIYPYICFTVFLAGSLIRFDRDQYTWKSESSQLLRAGQLRLGNNLFHVGILFLLFGHTVGLLTPHAVYSPFVSAPVKQLMAMISGGIFGLLGFAGVSVLLHRRLSDPRILRNSRTRDVLVLCLLWLQFLLGLVTIPMSGQHMDGSVMIQLAEAVQRVATFRGGVPELLAGVSWVFKLHIFLGLTIFLVFPFTRLVHAWSGFGTIAYLGRPYQLVRSRRLGIVARER
jgi:nitrate reductase gamma subunit